MGDTVRWRWVNGGELALPMHLHGFHFRRTATGNGSSETMDLQEARVEVRTDATTERLRLFAQQALAGRWPDRGFVLQRGSAPRADSVEIPGTPLILKQGAHVAITVINRLPEPTTVHWHGMELESYFDGVSGWSGSPSPEAMLFCSMELRQRWRLNSGPTRT